MLGEQMSASSCRRVHSEILESVSKIKCSLLGRKGGLLHSYGNYGSDIALNEIVGSSGICGSIYWNDFYAISMKYNII